MVDYAQVRKDIDEHDSINTAKRVNVVAGSISIDPGDIQIGAVEIKNATTDDRSTVDTLGNLSVMNFGQLVPKVYDYLALTYVTSGNGLGEVETVTYKTGGSGGTTVATLTLTYDANNKVASVTRV